MRDLPTNKKYTAAEMERMFADIMDPGKVLLHCGIHNYVANEKPPDTVGCKNCWEVWWWHKIATTPPHLRQQRLEEAYRSVSDAVKAYERGEWDFEPFLHPEIKHTKESD